MCLWISCKCTSHCNYHQLGFQEIRTWHNQKMHETNAMPMRGESLELEPGETKDRDVAPSCQIPWTILHQVFVKWNNTRLSEDVQNQQMSQEMTMIHRVLIMNIINVLAHGDTDEIRPSDMDNKLMYMLAFSHVYPVCQMYIRLNIHIYNPTSLPSLPGHIVDRIILTRFSHYRLHSSWLTGIASALDSSTDLIFRRFHK